jgi:hypothetical protein
MAGTPALRPTAKRFSPILLLCQTYRWAAVKLALERRPNGSRTIHGHTEISDPKMSAPQALLIADQPGLHGTFWICVFFLTPGLPWIKSYTRL